ncbi:hypothetical protein H2200_010566 [Cladophialophora chaetospira]|uniref:J domain-containing protein n=1 Tax=Cladophialophora chaetospira TaxID=386627 RepID=A0AA38X1P9_9EURO|nr:hypothetical protein H2200_010566 [Cladophialophora chaetospira]
MDLKTAYKILGLPRGADSREVLTQYHRLAKTFHPDKCEDKEAAHENFIRLKDAYDIIVAFEKSGAHDDETHKWQPPKGKPGWEKRTGNQFEEESWSDEGCPKRWKPRKEEPPEEEPQEEEVRKGPKPKSEKLTPQERTKEKKERKKKRKVKAKAPPVKEKWEDYKKETRKHPKEAPNTEEVSESSDSEEVEKSKPTEESEDDGGWWQ